MQSLGMHEEQTTRAEAQGVDQQLGASACQEGRTKGVREEPQIKHTFEQQRLLHSQ